VNTLMVQEVLALPEWEGVLTADDRRGADPALLGPHPAVRRGEAEHGPTARPRRSRATCRLVPASLTEGQDRRPAQQRDAPRAQAPSASPPTPTASSVRHSRSLAPLGSRCAFGTVLVPWILIHRRQPVGMVSQQLEVDPQRVSGGVN
jgi:hypothetical protein